MVSQRRSGGGTLVRFAGEQGIANAQVALGRMYADGRGVLKDNAEAGALDSGGGRAGPRQCTVRPWLMYSAGIGVLKDSVIAHMWFNIAGANGSEQARTSRDLFEDEMTRAEINRATELARKCMASGLPELQTVKWPR